MNRYLFIFLSVLIVAPVSMAEETKVVPIEITLSVGGMVCLGCVKRVEKVLSSVEGVLKSEVSLKENRAVVTTKKEVKPEALVLALKKAGFSANLKTDK